MAGRSDEAEALLRDWLGMFPERFYVELAVYQPCR